MANVVNRHTKQRLYSVNTPDFPPEDWLINPDLSGVADVSWKYVKIDGNSVVEMTRKEKNDVDAAELTQYKKDKILAMKERVSLHLLTKEDRDFTTFESLVDAALSKKDVDDVEYPRTISTDSLEAR